MKRFMVQDLRIKKSFSEKGQSLITMLFIMVVAITIISASAVIVLTNISSASTAEQGSLALFAAEGGIQNAILRLIRNPSYTGETFTIGDTTVTVQVSPGYATASAVLGKVIRKIQVQTVYNNGNITISSWKEI